VVVINQELRYTCPWAWARPSSDAGNVFEKLSTSA
jgi:hypothetical protein